MSCVLALGLSLAGCVIPPPFHEEGEDAARDYIPVITDSVPDMPGFVTLVEGRDPFTVDVRDGDLDDVIYLRVFRDYSYDEPTPPLNDTSKANDPASGSDTRTFTLDTAAWCNGLQGRYGVNLIFDVVVADRPFDRYEIEPRYRAVTEGGEQSERSWVLICPPPA